VGFGHALVRWCKYGCRKELLSVIEVLRATCSVVEMDVFGKMSWQGQVVNRDCHGYTRGNPWAFKRAQEEPKRIVMKEIWSKYCFDHSSFISYPFGLFLGSFESPRVSTGIPMTIPSGESGGLTMASLMAEC
jgi:hypothetical protein